MNKKNLLFLFAMAGIGAISASGALILYDGFTDAASGDIPTNWISDDANAANNHGYVAAGSLSYPGLAPSTGNSFGLGEKTADYTTTFTPTNPADGSSIYFSFLIQITDPNAMTGASSYCIRLEDSTDNFGSGISIGKGSADYTTDLMGFSLNNRIRGYTNVESVKTSEVYSIAGVTHLVVGSYTDGVGVSLYINPDSSFFGGAVLPTATLTMAQYQSDEDFDRIHIGSSGSGQHPAGWQIDELRVGTTWADVTPVPEPTTVAFLLGLSALGLVAWRRR